MVKVTLLHGNVMEALKQIPDNSIDCIVTSPPYWGMRIYPQQTNVKWPDGWYGQLGNEPKLDMYIEHLLQITYELKRVLKPTGVMFWVHGNSYAGHMGKRSGWSYISNLGDENQKDGTAIEFEPIYDQPDKCLTMQNYRFVLKMVDIQKWILRNVIIWYKPNHLPESCKDRFTSSYEPVFMLVKNRKYYFDLDSVRVPHKESGLRRMQYALPKFGSNPNNPLGKISKGIPSGCIPIYLYGTAIEEGEEKLLNKKSAGNLPVSEQDTNCLSGKNPGDVWEIPSQSWKEAHSHFAGYSEELVRPCIKVGCPVWICKKCGKPRIRITKKTGRIIQIGYGEKGKKLAGESSVAHHGKYADGYKGIVVNEYKTVGWTDCGCNDEFEPGTVLDPFCGTGTTLKVAIEENRNAIGIEIVDEYIEMIKKRVNWGSPFIEWNYRRLGENGNR